MNIISNILSFIRKQAKILLIFYWLVLFTLTSIPTVPVDFGFKWQDKLEHLLAFGVLSFLVANFLTFSKNIVFNKKSILIILGIILIYAAIDELHQPFFGRICDIWDVTFDFLGGIAGLIVFNYYYGMLKNGTVL